jgi:hypothetical protein
LEVDVAQFAEGAVRPDFRGADGAFEDAGDFGKREFLEAREQEDFAIIVVQTGERGMQQRVIVVSRRVLRGVRRLVRVFIQIDGVGRVRRVA